MYIMQLLVWYYEANVDESRFSFVKSPSVYTWGLYQASKVMLYKGQDVVWRLCVYVPKL